MKEELNTESVDNIYRVLDEVIIIGLTGRTGSGCSTVAKILSSPSIDELCLKDVKTYEFESAEERKRTIIQGFMKGGNWKPFTVIEMSSIILAQVMKGGMETFERYLDAIQDGSKEVTLKIGDYSDLKKDILDLLYMFEQSSKHCLEEVPTSIDEIKDFYDFFTRVAPMQKSQFKKVFDKYSCFETRAPRLSSGSTAKYHLYTYLLQEFGNNIRSSGDPYKKDFSEKKRFQFYELLNNVIEIVIAHDRVAGVSSRICIDAIRNPFEAYYLRDKYRAFTLMSVNTQDESRIKRLGALSDQEIENLDRIEYPTKFNNPEEVFYHQNMSGCLEASDIHVINPQIGANEKRFNLTAQLLKYVALMIKPGLVTPTAEERCMQLAYNAKLNSGCLSRQVGAVVTTNEFSVLSVGWNDVPKGQISCNLRDIYSYCKNEDHESYSQYELSDGKVKKVLTDINRELGEDLHDKGINCPYCFKDVYAGVTGSNNQVFTRSLHAEENAFLQIAKNNSHLKRGGFLFTTASPCVLCAKKAYQLGIRKIFYIDPYPDISKSHVLSFGIEGNPELCLFNGAIGNAFVSLYTPRIPYKDELEILTGRNFKKFNNIPEGVPEIKLIKYKKVEHELTFESRERMVLERRVSFKVCADSFSKLTKQYTWTGSSCGETRIVNSSVSDLEYKSAGDRPNASRYSLVFNPPLKRDDEVTYETSTVLKDEEHVMRSFFAYTVSALVNKLTLIINDPLGLLKNIRVSVYADKDMQIKIGDLKYKSEDVKQGNKYIFSNKPNTHHVYSFEWEFVGGK